MKSSTSSKRQIPNETNFDFDKAIAGVEYYLLITKKLKAYLKENNVSLHSVMLAIGHKYPSTFYRKFTNDTLDPKTLKKIISVLKKGVNS